MAQVPKDKKILGVGKLNSDDFYYAIPPNDWINSFNIRNGSTDKGFTGTIEAIGGTVRLSQPSPSVSFITIGSISDIPNNRFIYFQYNVFTSQHKIECFDYTDNTIYLVLVSSQVTGGLNFNKNYPIHGRVVNGVMYWTDDYNPPRKLNIDAAIKTNQPSYSTDQAPYTVPLEASVISLIRQPPTYALNVGKFIIGSPTINYVADFAGQFAWRYIFRDNEISVLSPISSLINYNSVTDLVNAVLVTAVDIYGNPLPIPQDVQVVDFCVRYAGDPSFFIINSWDKRIAADALEIANHNAGIAALNYTFLNDRIGIALGDAYSVKPFDSVPLLTKTLETGLNRLFLGNNVSSYDTPVLSSLSGVLHAETNHSPFQNPMFKSGGVYQIGIIFRDAYKRIIGNVFTNSSMRFQVPDRDYNDTTYYDYIAWTLSNAAAANEIPVDAYFYEIVITKNLVTRFFVQAKSGGMKYAIKDPSTGVITYQDTYVASAYGLAFDTSLLNSEGLGYSFQENDILRLWQSASATTYSLPVITVQDGYIISKLENLGSFAVQPDIIFEVYSPYKELTSEPYWTIGETFLVTNPTQPSRTYATLGSNIYGDIYTFNRSAPSGTYIAENMSPNPKFWKQWNTNSGEPNFVINSEQVNKYTAVQWSNVIVEGSQTNGLSTFDALDEKILPITLGTLQKLQQTSKVTEQGNVILAIGEKETASCYLGEVQVVAADRNAFLASSPNVIGTVNVLKGSFGTINPESVVEYRGNVYWLDMYNGRYIQYSANGLFPISDYKTTTFWKQFCEQFLSMTAAEIEDFGGRPFIFSAVDPHHDELLISIPKLLSVPPAGYLPDSIVRSDDDPVFNEFNIYDGQAKSMVYKLGIHGEPYWMGAFSFTPECLQALNNQLYTCKDGQLWLHNQDSVFNNFYGVQYRSKIFFVSNIQAELPKLYHNVSVMCNLCPKYMYFYNTYPVQQCSTLDDFNFVPKEGTWYANIFRNKLVPTATGCDTDGLLTGEKMRNTNMLIEMDFLVTTTQLELRVLEIGYQISVGHTT